LEEVVTINIETARANVRRVLYEHLDDNALTASRFTAVVEALIAAVTSAEVATATATATKTCGTLWEFVQAVAPSLGITVAPHVEQVCAAAERLSDASAQARAFLEASKPTLDMRLEDIVSAERAVAQSFPEVAYTRATAAEPAGAVLDARTRLLMGAHEYIGKRGVACDRAVDRICRAAIAYAAANLAETGEAETGAARLLLAQIAEEL
jgi:hypothetical protein